MARHNGRANLTPLNKRPEAEKRRIQSMGGKASVEKRRMQKTIRELVRAIFWLPLERNRKIVNPECLKSFRDLSNANLTPAIAGIGKLAQQVANGDLKAIELWFKLSGEGQSQEINLKGMLDATVRHDLSGLTDDELNQLAEITAKIENVDIDTTKNETDGS